MYAATEPWRRDITEAWGELWVAGDTGLTVARCEPYPGKTILFMSDWLYTAGVKSEREKNGGTVERGAGRCMAAQNIWWFMETVSSTHDKYCHNNNK